MGLGRNCRGQSTPVAILKWLGWVVITSGAGSQGEETPPPKRDPRSAVPSLLPLLSAQHLLARAYLHGIYISFASRSIKNLTSSRLPGAACPAW